MTYMVNIARLLMDGRGDGLERALRSRGQTQITTIAPTPPHLAHEDPEESIARALEMIEALERQNPGQELILIGRSYGGFIALLVACRRAFNNILKVVAIEAPLNPDIKVGPPLLLPPLWACSGHYKKRPELSAQARTYLAQGYGDKVLAIRGGQKDSIVPREAQCIAHAGVLDLPENMGPKPWHIKKLPLPLSYRTHVDWSREKMAAICDVIIA